MKNEESHEDALSQELDATNARIAELTHTREEMLRPFTPRPDWKNVYRVHIRHFYSYDTQILKKDLSKARDYQNDDIFPETEIDFTLLYWTSLDSDLSLSFLSLFGVRYRAVPVVSVGSTRMVHTRWRRMRVSLSIHTHGIEMRTFSLLINQSDQG